MGESPGHAQLGGSFGVLIQQKLRDFTMSSGWQKVPEEVAVRVKRVIALYTGKVQVPEKIWYQPDGSFGLLGPSAAKVTAVYEVS